VLFRSQRPGWRKRVLDYKSDDSAHFLGELFQGASAYYPDTGSPTIVVAIGGRLYEIRTDNFEVTDISIPGPDYDSAVNPQAWFWQSEKWLIKQNGVDLPVFWDGVSARRPLANEIKTGTCGVYAWGRNWYARPDGLTYRATDLVRENGLREDVLKETSNDYLDTSGDFGIPATAGHITAMFVPGALDNSLGQGPVHVGTENSVFSCNAPVERTVWKDLTDPIQTVSLNINGPTGDRGVTVHNGDVFYRSKDGVRSYILARREFTQWGNVPISREVGVFIDPDNSDLLNFGSAVAWKNMRIQTCMPKWQNGLGCTHSGLVVLDFDLISTLKERFPPAWNGLWTGLDIHQILIVTVGRKDRCFMFVRNESGILELWEMDLAWRTDEADRRIQWLVVGRQMDFGRRDVLKKLDGGTLHVNDMTGEVDFSVSYKPDDYPLPVAWAQWSECANTDYCPTVGECLSLATKPPQYRTSMDLPSPPDGCNTIMGEQLTSGYTFQPIIAVEGAVTLKRFKMEAHAITETPQPKCGDEPCVDFTGCGIDPLGYRADAS
jgi:hypothetical protein